MSQQLTGIDIVIVNWNSGNFLSDCVRSVYENTDENDIDFHLYVIDNNSSDHSLQGLPMGVRDTLVRSGENLGFAKACNKGAAPGKSPFLLFLNPDTIVLKNTIGHSLQYLVSHPEIGILGVRQMKDESTLLKSCSRFLKARNLFFEITALSRISPKLFPPPTIMTDWDHDSSRFVDQVMGSFMLIRRQDFVRAGGMDERFFVYYEDMDLALRMNKSGKRSFYHNEISILHSGAGTTSSIKDVRLFLSLSSRISYARKNLSKGEFMAIILLTFITEPFSRLMFHILNLRLKGTVHVFRAYRMLYAWYFRKK